MKRNNQRVMIHGSNFKFFNFSFNGINLKNLLNTVTFYRTSSSFFLLSLFFLPFLQPSGSPPSSPASDSKKLRTFTRLLKQR